MCKKKGKGKLGMEKVREILRLRELGISKQAIADSCGVTRHTVRDYLAKAEAEGISHAKSVELRDSELASLFGKRKGGRPVKAAGKLDFGRMNEELRRKGVTKLLLYQEYLKENPKGYSYSQYCNLYALWQKGRGVEAVYPQEHKAGEKVFVDFSGLKFPIYRTDGSIHFMAEIFVGCLGFSNFTYVEALPSQKLEHFLGAHVRMFDYFGGVTRIVIPDNLKSAVKRACLYDPETNQSYREFACHYNLAIVPTRVAKPRDKAKVEKAVQETQRWLLAPLRDEKFYNLGELNTALWKLLDGYHQKLMQLVRRSRLEVFQTEEKAHLQALPQDRFQFSHWREAKVHPDGHIQAEKHFYSVPYSLIGETVAVRINEKIVEVFHNNQRIALHARSSNNGRYSTERAHRDPVQLSRPGMSQGELLARAKSIGAETALLVNNVFAARRFPEEAIRPVLGILGLAKHGATLLELAAKKANDCGATNYRFVKSCINDWDLKNKPTSDVPLVHPNLRRDFN